MIQGAAGEQRVAWAFWAAAILAVIGGTMPIVFAGTSDRLSGVLIPFVVGAAAFGACAVLHGSGRTFTAIVYFIAGLAIVFGLLAMFSLPLRLAVLGTCPAAPAACTTGLPRPLSDAENSAMGAAAAFGIFAIFVGFFGLVVLYRRMAVASFMPPSERKIPAMPAAPPAPAREDEDLPELPAHEVDSTKNLD